VQTRLGKLIALIPAFVRLEYALLNASAPCGDVRWSVGGLREQLIIASVVNIFLHSTGLDWAISVIGVIVFVGLTAYDTQRIKEMYDVNDDGTISGRKAVMGALRLYLDFINLFLMLLRIFGNRG
jgi:Inhibitor of apoptosis-promoting Bax1